MRDKDQNLKAATSQSKLSDGLSCAKVKKEYILDVIDRKTGKIVQTETRKSATAFDKLWGTAMLSVNSLKYKLKTR